MVKAFNPGREDITEGYGRIGDGREVRALEGAELRCLVKLLDAAERLVIQVHPTREFAAEYFHSEYGKTECWYFLDCDEDACVYIGFKEGITAERWREVFDCQDIDTMLGMLHRIPVKKGDCVFVDGGVPHAIGKGCFMVEIQEPTDLMGVTERQTPSGRVLPESKLHGGIGIDNMMKMFCYEGKSEAETVRRHRLSAIPTSEGVSRLVGADRTEKFALLELTEGARVCPDRQTGIVIVTEGEGALNGVPVKRGDRVLYLRERALSLTGEAPCKAVLCC